MFKSKIAIMAVVSLSLATGSPTPLMDLRSSATHHQIGQSAQSAYARGDSTLVSDGVVIVETTQNIVKMELPGVATKVQETGLVSSLRSSVETPNTNTNPGSQPEVLAKQTIAGASFTVIRQSDGPQTLIKIYNAAAPTSFEFPIDVGFGYEPRKMSDGSIAVVDTITGTIVGGFEVPWAKDALGNAIPTNFSINRKSTGTYSLIQNVKHGKGTAYPVIADPDWWSAAKCAAELAILFTPAKVFKIKSSVTLIQKIAQGNRELEAALRVIGGATELVPLALQLARGGAVSAAKRAAFSKAMVFVGTTLIEFLGVGGCGTFLRSVR